MTGLTAPDALALAKADANRRYNSTRLSKPVALSGPPSADREYPTLARPLTEPVLTTADAIVDKLYWPSFVYVGGVPGAVKDWALLYSSDHEGIHADSGLFIVWADDPLDAATYSAAILLYRDDVSGNQTETPWPIVHGGKLFVYYQQNNVTGSVGDQVSSLVVFDDLGDAPTRYPAVIDVEDTETLPLGNDGYHCGYFTCIIYNGQWYGWSLFGGTKASGGIGWSSYDGINWYPDPDVLGFGAEWLVSIPDATKDWIVQRPRLIEWRGKWWALFLIGPMTSGLGAAPFEIYAAPLAPDLLTLIGQPIRIHPDTYQEWEQDQIDFIGAPFEYNGRLYVTYRAGDTVVSTGIMEVVTR